MGWNYIETLNFVEASLQLFEFQTRACRSSLHSLDESELVFKFNETLKGP